MSESTKSRIETIVDHWNKLPNLIKVYLAISTLISSGSLASLSDTVFAWKGFILNGIVFYRSIMHPVGLLLRSVFNAEISTAQLDLIIFFGLFFSSYMRFTVAKHWGNTPASKKTKALYVRAAIAFLLSWSLAVGFVSAAVLTDMNTILQCLAFALYVFPFFYPFQVLNYEKLNIPNESALGSVLIMKKLRDYSNNRIRLYIEYYGPVVIALAFTFICAAVNLGIVRDK